MYLLLCFTRTNFNDEISDTLYICFLTLINVLRLLQISYCKVNRYSYLFLIYVYVVEMWCGALQLSFSLLYFEL